MCFTGGSGTAVVRLKAIDGTLSSAELCSVSNLPQRSAPKVFSTTVYYCKPQRPTVLTHSAGSTVCM